MNDLGSAAVRYARRGRAVFPLRPMAKTPLTEHGVKDATTDLVAVTRWWRRCPEANIGCAAGQPSGFWSLDIDGIEGEETLRDLVRQHSPLPATVELITGCGRQVFFRHDPRVGNSVRRLGAGLDTRSTGGYTILPPSIHPSGRVYAWSVDGDPSEVRLAAAPDWLIDRIKRPEDCATAAPEEWRDIATNGVAEGARNQTIARLAGYLFRRYVDFYLVLELLSAWNLNRCRPPLEQLEVERIVASIGRRELMRRNNAA